MGDRPRRQVELVVAAGDLTFTIVANLKHIKRQIHVPECHGGHDLLSRAIQMTHQEVPMGVEVINPNGIYKPSTCAQAGHSAWSLRPGE
jgi:hypothetical protein